MSLTTIRSDCLTVTVSSVGAEIQSIQDRQGNEYMWQGDPAYWANRAPILFPVAGGFRDDEYVWQGKTYPMAKHGIVRNVAWEVESAGENRAVFSISRKTEGFPFEYTLRAIFTVTGNQLRVDYAVNNQDQQPFYFSVGAHEAYATPGGIQDYEIVFDEEETLLHSLLEGNLNSHETQVIAERTRTLPLRYDYFAVDALVFRSVKSKGVTLRGVKNGRKLRVDFPEHPILMFWDKPGAAYICIEPWCNGPDFVDAPKEIDQKFGFMRLEPGQTITRSHTITIG
ncbi:MAG: aldose 1-epimerase family protein [Clostridia bacterium]|nr:aldose 1-epimerase family protein [Clostridia bacterium]